jgi:hypothetical protein
MKTDVKKSKSMALEGSPIPLDEFRQDIAKAEKGPFYTPEQAKKLMASWRKKRNSL